MIAPHVQTGTPRWTDCLPLLPDGTWVKAVNEQGTIREVKLHNARLRVVFRYEDTHDQVPSTNYEANKEKARLFFAKFLDGTFWQQEYWRWLNAVEEWNEYLADSQSEEERAMWLSWCEAVNDVWTTEYRTDPRLAHVRLVSCNTAVGNDIPWQFARTVRDHDGILGYHGYIKVTNGVIDPGDWRYHSGRFATMDAGYRVRGINVKWLGTEGGAYHGVYEGWKHSLVYGGNLDNYIQGALKHRVDNVLAWNNAHGGCWMGDTLFTVGGGSRWEYYELSGDEWRTIATWLRDYVGGNGMGWQDDVWGESVNEQISRGIPLNPNAGLQQMIIADGDYTPVHRERQITANDGKRYGFMAGESTSGAGPRKVWVYEVPWSGPQNVTVITDPN